MTVDEDDYPYRYSSTTDTESAHSTPYTSPSSSTETTPASTYSEQFESAPSYDQFHSHAHTHTHFQVDQSPKKGQARQYYPSSPYEKYEREHSHSYFGSSAISALLRPAHHHPSSSIDTVQSIGRRKRLTWSDVARFVRPKFRIRHRKMPLSRRGRTCVCVVLPLLLGSLLFLSTFPARVPWSSGERAGAGQGVWSGWEGGDAKGWLGSVIGSSSSGLNEPIPTSLWSYIPFLPSAPDLSAPAADAWSWLTAHKASGRRASWGGLSGVGASEYLRDNLREDRGYVTTFPLAGFNNQVMDIMNSIQLALASNRIPILATFKPDIYHLIGASLPLSVGDVFDLSALAAAIDTPIVEAHELRIEEHRADERMRYVTYDGEPGVRSISANGTELKVGDRVRNVEARQDEIGCWSMGMMYGGMAGTWGGMDPLKVSWTPTGSSPFPIINSKPAYDHWSLSALASLINAPPSSPSSLPLEIASRLKEKEWPTPERVPEQQLACLESTYWLISDPESNDLHDEWRKGKGTWETVGRAMRFQPGLKRMAEDYAREMFGVGWGEEVPPYMAIHMRRGDFDAFWKNITPRQWAYRASQIMDEAKAMGIEAFRVLVTTDETDEAYLEPFRQMGWRFADHAKTRTGERLGYWFPTLIDGILLAQAKVFMGIPSSTTLRRVMDWEGGHGGWADPAIQVPDEWEWSW